mmetsp:Transcript_12674/g.25731  ORF Transcript_12674/g.25731 Transcript_12674/m.25731 type:complete len:89 (+) Transcript_12674:86-352(+)
MVWILVDPCQEIFRLIFSCLLPTSSLFLQWEDFIMSHTHTHTPDGGTEPGVIKKVMQGNPKPARLQREGGEFVACELSQVQSFRLLLA